MLFFKNNFFLIWFLVNSLSLLNAETLIKAFYHRGQCEDKIVFYLDQKPTFTKQNRQGQVVYRFNNIKLEPAILELLGGISRQAQKYQIKFSYHKQVLHVTIDVSSAYKISAAQFKPISQPAGFMIKISHARQKQTSTCARLAGPKEIVLDFGHGGSDTGASFGKICEKDVVRKVGLKLAKLLTKQGYVVYFTRLGDEFVSLEDRTYFANLQTGASLFVSLHANHAPNKMISGLETYHMSDLLFSNLDDHDICNNFKLLNSRSTTLASLVHNNILQHQNKTGATKLVDRKVKQSVSQVLLGVEMPAILIELGFMSNPKEARQLNSPRYQRQLAAGICNGIMAYVAQI